jgi:hypothetical protein
VNLKVNQVSDLNKIIKVISKFDGVIGVLLLEALQEEIMTNIRIMICSLFLRIKTQCGDAGMTFFRALEV